MKIVISVLKVFQKYIILFLKIINWKIILKALSFKNNKIRVVSVDKYFMQGDYAQYKFFGLQFLDLSNNSILYFNVSIFESLPIYGYRI